MPPRDNQEHWALDRRVPIALIVTMVAQIVGFSWFASKLDSRVGTLEERTMEARERLSTFDREAKEFSTRLIRLEEKQSATLDVVREIRLLLEPRRRSDANGLNSNTGTP